MATHRPAHAAWLVIAASVGLPLVAGDGPIQDNSFLVEEAYNQEPGVVQHISTFLRGDDGGWAFSFTQEWPAPAQRHQLSFTATWLELEQPGTDEVGFSDLLVNWRIQAHGSGSSRLAFAPRLSLLFPTGDDSDGLGAGHLGAQVNLPLSVELSPHFVAHTNLGATFVPDARDPGGEEADIFAYNLGQSVIWLARPKFNVMLEASYVRAEEVAGSNATTGATAFFVSPGLRWAIDFDSGLQIVPGIAAPIGVGASSDENAVFAYLSFEHAFRRGR